MQQPALKLISLNIELNQHYETVLSFLRKEQADIVCLQEVLESDMPRLDEATGMRGAFAVMSQASAPQTVLRGVPRGATFGIALFVRVSAVFSTGYYFGDATNIPQEQNDNQEKNLMLLRAAFSHQGKEYCVGTTHFTWTSDGSVSEVQRTDIRVLLAVLARTPEIVFCGDFNAPRGGEIWAKLATRYQDNIPKEYHSSLDPHLHRLLDSKKLVVDGLWSTPAYRVSGVRLVEGVSDHKAVVGFIERV